MLSISKVSSFLVAAGLLAGCSDNQDGNTGGSGGTSSSSGGAAASTGGTSSGGSSSGGAATSTGGSGGALYTRDGVCLRRNKSTVTATGFEGYEEWVLMTADGNDTDLCVVHYDVKRVGPAADPAGCAAAAFSTDGKSCEWTHEVQYSNPKVMLDTDGACANSDRRLTAAKIASIDGSKITFGFAAEAAGHVSEVMAYSGTKWDIWVNGTWDQDTGLFRYDRREGPCAY